jgi:hypothetical protein
MSGGKLFDWLPETGHPAWDMLISSEHSNIISIA